MSMIRPPNSRTSGPPRRVLPPVSAGATCSPVQASCRNKVQFDNNTVADATAEIRSVIARNARSVPRVERCCVADFVSRCLCLEPGRRTTASDWSKHSLLRHSVGRDERVVAKLLLSRRVEQSLLDSRQEAQVSSSESIDSLEAVLFGESDGVWRANSQAALPVSDSSIDCDTGKSHSFSSQHGTNCGAGTDQGTQLECELNAELSDFCDFVAAASSGQCLQLPPTPNASSDGVGTSVACLKNQTELEAPRRKRLFLIAKKLHMNTVCRAFD
ncbi:MAG: hypothetical protein MHM6MM_003062 [Cercozoa sp. M6MM]